MQHAFTLRNPYKIVNGNLKAESVLGGPNCERKDNISGP